MTKFKCTAISDTHTYHEACKLKGGDFLFHSGDLSYFGQPDEITSFMLWMSKQPYKHKVFIAGNHDFGFEPLGHGKLSDENGDFIFRGRIFQKGLQDTYREWAKTFGLIYLDKEEIEIDGIRIYGIPDQPAFCGWAFNYFTLDEAEEIYGNIPENIDVLLTHGPAKGILDLPGIVSMIEGDNRLGCPTMLKHLARVKPKYHLFGHIHESFGKVKINGTTHINASFCGMPYTNFNKPINFVLEK